MQFSNQLNQRISKFENHLGQVFIDSRKDEDILFFNEVLSYNLLAGGKRLRPILVLELCQLYGGQYEEALAYALAIEMIHTYSLIHDDLPCMDDDDLRRGQATTHVKYSEDVAVLAGDALLNSAHEIMIDASIEQSDIRFLKAMQVVSRAAGKEGMIRGQLLDIQNEDKSLTLNQLNLINDLKTGQLLKASMVSGAIIGGASSADLATVERLAYLIGLMFQIKDDLLDVYGDQELLGKPVGSDEKNLKTTYPTILGLDETEATLRSMASEAVSIVKELPGDTAFLKDLISYIIDRKK